MTLLALAILAVLGLLVTPGPTRVGWYCVHCGAVGALLTACSVCGTVAKASAPRAIAMHTCGCEPHAPDCHTHVFGVPCPVCGVVASTPPPPEPEPEPAPEPIPPRHPVDPRRPRFLPRILAALTSRGEL